MARIAFVTLAVLLAVAPAGCRKPPATNAIPGAGTGAAAPAASAAGTDYRKLTKAQVEALIREKTGSAVILDPAGPNRYSGARQSPDGTAKLDLDVTVEAERITLETRGGGFTSREYITPRGLQVEELR
jgi:hypothetical protein